MRNRRLDSQSAAAETPILPLQPYPYITGWVFITMSSDSCRGWSIGARRAALRIGAVAVVLAVAHPNVVPATVTNSLRENSFLLQFTLTPFAGR